MYKQILDLLKYAKIGDGELIDIAKGKNKAPQTYKDFKKQLKWRLRKR